MSGVYHLEIKETAEELKQLLSKQKTASSKERVHLLYLLKTGQSQTISQAAEMLGRNRVTLHKWIRQYEIEGIEGLLRRKPVSGRPRTIPLWAEKALEKKLQEPQGFNGYQEIVEWLEQQLGIHTCYKTVHKLVHNKLKSSPKVPRPQSIAQQEEQQKAFKKNLADNLIMLNMFCIAVLCTTKAVRFWCEDETRIGLKTITGRKITARGVKPVGIEQWQFQATYLYGIIEPQTGESFFWEFSHLNTDCFQRFLNLVAENFVDSILIIQLDNGAFHKAKRLRVPDNIILLFQPPHSPQLNPIEQVWQYLKRRLRWLLPKNLEELRVALYAEINKLTKEIIASIAGRKYILNALSVAGF